MHGFISEIEAGVRDAIENAISLYYKCAWYEHHTECGRIVVFTNNRNEIDVKVIHGEEERNSHNIENAVLGVVPCWSDVEEEMRGGDDFNRNGFTNENDFIKWKYL